VRALSLYAPLPAGVRWHTRIRAFTCPLDAIVERLPPRGRLLEVGCGHGLFSNEAALRYPELDVLGVDPAPDKIRWAQASAAGRPNAAFRLGTLADVAERGFDAIAVLDVLYLIARRDWSSFLAGCRERLREGGRLLLKEVAPRPRWKFWRCVLQETLSVRLIGITLGRDFAFAGAREMAALLEGAGLSQVRVSELHRGYATPHVLYEAVRP
jgi:2-polyprenyl-6-hydroxyphenyl methylase/3-demethylubiquinone-9 3-methyltransferase